jgi:hypothetical protein
MFKRASFVFSSFKPGNKNSEKFVCKISRMLAQLKLYSSNIHASKIFVQGIIHQKSLSSNFEANINRIGTL